MKQHVTSGLQIERNGSTISPALDAGSDLGKRNQSYMYVCNSLQSIVGLTHDIFCL